MHLFIDTNAYLSFYHHTKDDIAALEKLLSEITRGNIALHVPRQVRDEWTRNRDGKLYTAAKEFQTSPLKSEIPRHMQGLAKAESYAAAIAEAKKARDILIAEAKVKARTYQLDVDVFIRTLFQTGAAYDHDPDVFAVAKLRAEMGNPPGKVGSYGDQYNWEMLLTCVPDVDLYIVTKDGDYMSALDGQDERRMIFPNAFLREEWLEKKSGSNLYVFDSLKAVLTHYDKTIALPAAPPVAPPVQEIDAPNADAPWEHTPLEPQANAEVVEIEESQAEASAPTRMVIPAEVLKRKRELIEQLIESPSFAVTHATIASLNGFFDYFTVRDANTLCDGALSNNQIAWIINDADVERFYSLLVSSFFETLDPTTLDGMIELLSLVPDDDGSDDSNVENSRIPGEPDPF